MCPLPSCYIRLSKDNGHSHSIYMQDGRGQAGLSSIMHRDCEEISNQQVKKGRSGVVQIEAGNNLPK